jgi:hypothetical protein
VKANKKIVSAGEVGNQKRNRERRTYGMKSVGIVHDGKAYYISLYFIYEYNLSNDALQRARKNGFPYIKVHKP